MNNLIETPLSLCEGWLKKKTTFNTLSLLDICIRNLVDLIRLYPHADQQEKLVLKKGLRNLLKIPAQFSNIFVDEILRSTWASQTSQKHQTIDFFLVHQLFSPLVTHLDLDRLAPKFRLLLVLRLPRCIPNLTHLTISLSREIVFHKYADNEFVKQISNLKLLKKVDVQDSIQVTDEALNFLESMRQLYYLDVSGTGVNPTRLKEFVQSHSSLVNLGSWDDLKDLDDASYNRILGLHSNEPDQNTVDHLVCKCKNLQHLRIRCTNTEVKLQRLGALVNLKGLDISGVSYRHSNLGVTLLGVSAKLTSLHLEHISGLDSCDLRTIGQMLRCLEKFTLLNCIVSRGNSLRRNEDRGNQQRLFTSIRQLSISSNISPSQFLMLTGHAVELERLQTGVSCWVSTRLLSHLIRLNPLSKLEYLRIDFTSDLCAAALFLLLRTAKSLKTIVGTELWQDIDSRTCADLNDVFRRHHLPHNLLPFNSEY